MANVIVKSRYLTSKKHMTEYLNYMATREGVELLPDNIKSERATNNQQKFINSHLTEMKKLKEYNEYLLSPTVLNASRVITAYSIGKNQEIQDFQQYAYRNVQKVSSDKNSAATQKQKDFINAHIKGLEDLIEYADYIKNPTSS